MRTPKRKQPKSKNEIDFNFLDIAFENCEIFRVKKENCIVKFYSSGHIKSIFVENLTNLSNILDYPYKSKEEIHQRLLRGNDITGLYFVESKWKNKRVDVTFIEKDPHVTWYPNLIQTTKLIRNGIEFAWEDGQGIDLEYAENNDNPYGCWDLTIPHNIYEKIKDKLCVEAYRNIIVTGKKTTL